MPKLFSILAVIVLLLSFALPVAAQPETPGRWVEAKVDYVGTDDVRLLITDIGEVDELVDDGKDLNYVTYEDGYEDDDGKKWDLQQWDLWFIETVRIEIWRKTAGGNFEKIGLITFNPSDPYSVLPIEWYDEGGLGHGETYQYGVTAGFQYEVRKLQRIKNVWSWTRNEWQYGPSEQIESVQRCLGYPSQDEGSWDEVNGSPVCSYSPQAGILAIDGSATPGHVWGKVLRDTTWSGVIQVQGVNVGGYPSVHYRHAPGVTLTLAPSSRVTTGGDEWSETAIRVFYSNLVAHNVTFDGSGKANRISYLGNAVLGQAPAIDIRNSTFVGQVKIDSESWGMSHQGVAKFVLQGNSGDATGEIRALADPATPFIFSENNLPGVQLQVQYPNDSSPVETRIEDNTLKSIDILGRQVEQPPAADWSVSITGNTMIGYEFADIGTLMVRGLEGTRSLVIEGNEITGLGSMYVQGPAWWVEDVNDWPTADEEAFFVIDSNAGFHLIDVKYAPGGRIENNEGLDRILVQNIGGSQTVLIKGNIFEEDTPWNLGIKIENVEREDEAAFHIEGNLNAYSIEVDNVPGVVIRNNQNIGAPEGDCGIIVKNFSGARGAVVEGNTFGVDHAVIEVRDSDQFEKEGIHVRANRNVATVKLQNTTGATLEDNEIGTDGGIYSTPPHGIEIQESHHNIIRNNTLRLPENKIPGQYDTCGILMGLYPRSHLDDSQIEIPRATYNQITGNRIENYNYGVGLGSAADNVITGNTFRDNRFCVHLGPYRNRSGTITHIAYPYGNQIRNNAFYHNTRYILPGHVRLKEPSAAIHNSFSIAKTEGPNIVGGPYLGGNYWSRYDGIDENGDGIGNSWYYPTGVEDYWNRDERPLVKFALLQLSAAALNPSDSADFYGIAGEYDYESGAENIPIIHAKLAASDLDDWEVTSLTFQTEGTGNEKNDVVEARLYLGNLEGDLLGTKVFAEDDGEITFTFNPAIIIEKGTSKSFLLVYDFRPERAWPCNGYGGGSTWAEFRPRP